MGTNLVYAKNLTYTGVFLPNYEVDCVRGFLSTVQLVQ